MGVLDKILSSKREEIPSLRTRKLPEPPSEIPAFIGRRGASGPVRLLCEIKMRSPSAGELSSALTVRERAQAYDRAGASAISILCDGPFFGGAYEDLLEARQGCQLPLLCKEFIIDECQLDAARAFGASAALLIVRCIEDKQLETLIEGAEVRGLAPLVEVFTQEEAQRALDCGAQFIGVNARDLDTLEMNTERAAEVLKSLPDGVVATHLSGVKTVDDIQKVKSGRADAALIGEVLMRQEDPSELLAALVGAARGR